MSLVFKTSEECAVELVSYTLRMQEGGIIGDEVDCDDMPVRAARASFGKQDKTGKNPEADKKLMNFLAREGHLTPFEYQHATFLIEVPLFIRSQIHRHRTFSFNEISRRYTSENLAFWVPDKWRQQAKDNKQASDGELDMDSSDSAYNIYKRGVADSLFSYECLLEEGVPREQARAALPQSLLTQFYMGGNLRNWAHYVHLRREEHAQLEVQIPTHKIVNHLRGLWPESCEALGI